jgi:hypothetical protein
VVAGDITAYSLPPTALAGEQRWRQKVDEGTTLMGI